MPEVCAVMQKLLDDSNWHTPAEYIEGTDETELVSWDDDMLARTDENIKLLIRRHNDIIDHFEKCNHEGCKELMQNWKPYKRFTDRNSMLTGKVPIL